VHEVQVWIEDTDAYGIVYHANYARFVERAAHALLGRAACAAAFSERGVALGLRRVEGLKFTNAAVLGDALSVSLVPISIDEARGALHVSASISRADDATPIWSCSLATFAFTHAQSGARVAWPLFEPRVGGECTAELMRAAPPPPPPPLRAKGEALPCSVALNAILEADELSVGGGLCLHAALRYFERQRSQVRSGYRHFDPRARGGLHVCISTYCTEDTLGISIPTQCVYVYVLLFTLVCSPPALGHRRAGPAPGTAQGWHQRGGRARALRRPGGGGRLARFRGSHRIRVCCTILFLSYRFLFFSVFVLYVVILLFASRRTIHHGDEVTTPPGVCCTVV